LHGLSAGLGFIMLRPILIGITVFTLASCASTDSVGKAKGLEISGFSKLEDGGSFHKGSGLVCPAVLNGFDFKNDLMIALDGSDVACSYSESDKPMTLYLTESRGEAFEKAYAGSVLSAAFVGAREGLKLDNEMSQLCTLTGLVAVAAEKPDGVFTYESAILKNDNIVSIVAMHPIADSFMKIRYTQKFSKVPTQDDAVKMCIETANSMVSSSRDISQQVVKCRPKFKSLYQPPLKLGGSGRTIQIKDGEICSRTKG